MSDSRDRVVPWIALAFSLASLLVAFFGYRVNADKLNQDAPVELDLTVTNITQKGASLRLTNYSRFALGPITITSQLASVGSDGQCAASLYSGRGVPSPDALLQAHPSGLERKASLDFSLSGSMNQAAYLLWQDKQHPRLGALLVTVETRRPEDGRMFTFEKLAVVTRQEGGTVTLWDTDFPSAYALMLTNEWKTVTGCLMRKKG